jgi:hypothetical protein
MLPEQLKYFYEVLGVKNPPLTREEVAWKVALFCGDGKLNVAENLYVRFARGRATWCYRYLRNGHDCVMTLGGYTDEREGHGNITLTGALAKADQLDLIRRTCPDSDLLDLRREAQRELAGNSLSLEQKDLERTCNSQDCCRLWMTARMIGASKSVSRPRTHFAPRQCTRKRSMIVFRAWPRKTSRAPSRRANRKILRKHSPLVKQHRMKTNKA